MSQKGWGLFSSEGQPQREAESHSPVLRKSQLTPLADVSRGQLFSPLPGTDTASSTAFLKNEDKELSEHLQGPPQSLL